MLFISRYFYSFLHKHFFSKSSNIKKEIYQRKQIIDSDNSISIISNNCLAGCIYHDYGLRFTSPIINCYINWIDFPDFALSLKGYLQSDIIIEKTSTTHPTGTINYSNKNISIHFIHYESFDDAKRKWDERKKRSIIKILFLL